MKKTLLGGLAGGIVLYIWGFLAWMVFPLHDSSVHTLPAEDTIIATIQANVTEKGVYAFPAMPKGDGDMLLEEWKQKHLRGPIGLMMIDPAGGDPEMTAQYLPGLLLCLLAGWIAAWFLSRSTASASTYMARVAYCGMLGIFLSVTTHFMMWNWMRYPLDYTMAGAADEMIAWVLAGLAIGGIVKSPAPAEPS